jgi:glycosyltransferase involved in cell wall biosynthesis
MTLPTISIVTPSFNQQRWLGECIRSVQEQSTPPLEQQVMDGGSRDGSVQLLQTLQREFGERLRFVSEKDGGQAAALNAGIEPRAPSPTIPRCNGSSAAAR